MEIFRKNNKQLGFYTYLTFLSFILLGCSSEESVPMAASTPTPVYDIPVGAEETESETNKSAEETWQPLYEFTEENLIRWEQVKELETEDYYIELQENDIGEYPQIVLKEGKSIFCGTEHINSLLIDLDWWDYDILYADQYYISLWYGDKETGKTEGTYVINLQCPVTQSFVNMVDSLIGIQDDNDYRYAPWPSNGIILSFDKILEEIEKGNCYLDETGYALWQESPDAFIASVRRQFEEIEAGGYEEAYWARDNYDTSKEAYRMYIREGRVGFFIHPIDVWEANEGTEFYHFVEEPIETDRDFRVEVAYDWQKEAPVYHMPYEVYGERFESETYGTFYYPQIKGLDENIISALNTAMKHDLNENLVYMDLKEWNEKMKIYGYENHWEQLPPVNNPMVTYQTEKYLCIRQEFITDNDEALRFAEDWKRYHVYDLETGRSLQLKDIICLDEEFAMWLKEEKKVEARRGFPGWREGMQGINQTVEWMEEDLEYYPLETLSAVLEDAEFWLKEDSLYIRIPYYDGQWNTIRYIGGGTGHPYYIDYAEVRIALKDIQRFLKVEPWGALESEKQTAKEQFLEDKYQPDILFLSIIMNEKDAIRHFTLLDWNTPNNTDKNIDKGLSDIASMSEEEITDYIIEYSNGKYKNYKSVLWINMLEEVQRYFPHIKFGEWMWEVVGKADNKYLIEINSIDPNTREKNNSLIAQMLLEPDGTLKILENTVCTQPQNGLCVYASDIQYLYHGCAIREYNVEFYNEEKDMYLKAVIPLFSLENSIEWNEINRNIWEGLETWLNEQTNLQSGKILLNYEIRNLDNNLFSIFMQGSYETEGAESRQIALGMTVSLDSEELVSGKFLGVDTKQDSYFDFYVEDDRLYFINASQSIDLQYYTFEIDRNQRNVYTSDGRWVGECYYELPQIKPGVGELAIINDKLKEDMGRFFCGAARDFEVSVLEIMEGNDEDMAEIYGGPGYRCNVESKVTLNGDGKLGITYLYTINLGAIQEKGEAGVIYEIETGKTLEYEDWQGTLNLGK